jgi:hypothetical protein
MSSMPTDDVAWQDGYQAGIEAAVAVHEQLRVAVARFAATSPGRGGAQRARLRRIQQGSELGVVLGRVEADVAALHVPALAAFKSRCVSCASERCWTSKCMGCGVVLSSHAASRGVALAAGRGAGHRCGGSTGRVGA